MFQKITQFEISFLQHYQIYLFYLGKDKTLYCIKSKKMSNRLLSYRNLI